jgi:outer membrane receptor protein involved in Fe transport
MKKKLTVLLMSTLILYCSISTAQIQVITGRVTNSSSSETLSSVSVLVKGTPEGTYTDEKGNFKIATKQKLPLVLVFSSIGFDAKETQVNSTQELVVSMLPATTLEVGVVVSSTRIPIRILESPVSVERIGFKAITNSPATSYYDISGTLKGVDLTTSSLTFKTISTRGFNGSGSTRVNQIVEGMDNQAPGLNFFVGNFAGLTELDVESMELLPGASSALYGPGGMNGTVLINSKNPFKYQGFSFQGKQGIMNVDKSQRGNTTPFNDYSFRWAKAFNNKFAFKLGGQFIKATDWLANDSSNYQRSGTVGKVISGTRQTDPNYDGVNVYGDETSVDLRAFMAGVLPQGHPLLANPMPVSRTGYAEKDVIDPETKNIKLSGALHYKIGNNIEAQLMGYWATGNTVYTGNNRYVLKGIKIGQYKFELKHPDWLLRTYTTQEDAGEAYSATVTSQIFNEGWKRSFNPNNINGSWYPQYTGAFLQGLGAGLNMQAAHNAARAFADIGRPAAGSQQFNEIFDQVRKVPIPNGGRFLEKSQLWMSEGQYNFSNKIKFAEIIVGANVKKYILDSKGTLFIDTAGAINMNEVGAYGQVSKKLFKDYLALSISGRYDKNEDFKGHFTPRATALIKIAKDNNLRLSYQTAYRFPSTQQKYIRLNVGDYILLGGLPWVENYMNSKSKPVVELVNGVPSSTPYTYKELKPESVRSFEVGYKGLIANKLLIDAYTYFGKYQDFLGRNALYQPATNTIYSTVVNSSTQVKTHGFGFGLDYKLSAGYSAFFNIYSDVITDVPSGFQSYFNTPKYRLNTGFTNSGLGKSKRIGFNAVVHWQDAFEWDGELANGPLKAFSTVDAQVNYKFPKLKSMIKLGGTNILNHYYRNAYGNPKIGGLYYVSLAYNIL